IIDHEIISVPSASVLSVIRRDRVEHQSATRQIAVFADPVFESNDPRIKAPAPSRAPIDNRSPSPGKGSENLKRPLRGANPVNSIRLSRLPFTRLEAQAILGIATDAANLRALDFKADRALVTAGGLKPYRFIHFATHGILDTRHPEL